MLIPRTIIRSESTVPASRGNHRTFEGEIHAPFKNGWCSLQTGQGRIEIGGVGNRPLALAVVTETPGLQNSRQSDAGAGLVRRARPVDARVLCGGNAELGKKVLFRQPVLGDSKRVCVRMSRFLPSNHFN